MLVCVDQEKNIKVFRVIVSPEGGSRRERLGVVSKKDFQINDDFKDLSKDELAELNSVVALYKKAIVTQMQAKALSFPETVREALEYLEDHGDEAERKHVFTALMEGVRRMRKMSGGADEKSDK